MNTNRARTVYGLVALAVAITAAPGRADPAPAPSLESLREAVRRPWAGVHSLVVEHQISGEPLDRPEVVKKYMFLDFFPTQQVAFAFKGNRRYCRITQPDPTERLAVGVEPEWDTFPPGRDIKRTRDEFLAVARQSNPDAVQRLEREESRPIPPADPRVAAFDGQVLRCTAHRGRYEVWSPASLRNDDGWIKQVYLRAVFHVLPNAMAPEVTRADERLADALAAGLFTVEGAGVADGQPCVVVGRSPTERAWLDPALGYAVRRREFYDPQSGLVRERFVNDQFRDAGGVWLPWRCRWELCGWPAAPEAHRGRPLAAYTFAVSRLELNTVPDALFEERIPAGAEVLDTSILPPADGSPRVVTYVMPADLNALHDTVTRSLQAGRAAEHRGRWVRVFLWANGAALGALIGFALVRRARARWKVQTPGAV